MNIQTLLDQLKEHKQQAEGIERKLKKIEAHNFYCISLHYKVPDTVGSNGHTTMLRAQDRLKSINISIENDSVISLISLIKSELNKQLTHHNQEITSIEKTLNDLEKYMSTLMPDKELG